MTTYVYLENPPTERRRLRVLREQLTQDGTWLPSGAPVELAPGESEQIAVHSSTRLVVEEA